MKHFILLLLVFVAFACTPPKGELILISKDSNNRIEQWLHKAQADIITREFYTIPSDSMDFFLVMADGVVIGGGEDIHPSIYGKEEYVEVCGEFDQFRDSIEMLMIHHALAKKIPLLGICRGHQILNATNGGTLIPDIPSFLPTEIIHNSSSDSAHIVLIEHDSWLYEATGKDSLWVNSRHHQCIDSMAPGFKAVAFSADGIVESIQIIDESDGGFAAGVQWHPEGLLDEPSMQLANYFLKKVTAEQYK
ncbi:MAG: gamma-glutamyl-gamma-aminobutyrate hydrolase family protein [Prolixibacteraceae bacterium]